MNSENNCYYCLKDQRLDDLMIEVCSLNASILYLFREQTYKGRCVLVLKTHKRELFELDEYESENFYKDMSRAASAIKKTFSPGKINYAAFGDKVPHLHFHLVPKYENRPGWGEAFEITPKEKVFLKEGEYIEIVRLLKDNLQY